MKLYTPRLVLREIEESDLAALSEIYSDRQARMYEESLDAAADEKEMRARMDLIQADREANPRKRYRFAITIRPDNRMVGWVSLRPNQPGIREWEMGWTVQRAAWGQGYATEAARTVMRYAFEQLDVHRIIAFCHTENAASERVMQKLGMRREGCTRATRFINKVWTDELLYGILEEEFLNGR